MRLGFYVDYFAMGSILEFIENSSGGDFHCYGTKKSSLDESNSDVVAHESFDLNDIPNDTSNTFAESNKRRTDKIRIADTLILSTPPHI